MRESKEQTHRRYYEAFHNWFTQSQCDFWNECDAPESLATIAVELQDSSLAAATRERDAAMAVVDALKQLREAEKAGIKYNAPSRDVAAVFLAKDALDEALAALDATAPDPGKPIEGALCHPNR